MKRLYILGNGFDVAHKLPTAYLDYRKFLKGSIEIKISVYVWKIHMD